MAGAFKRKALGLLVQAAGVSRGPDPEVAPEQPTSTPEKPPEPASEPTEESGGLLARAREAASVEAAVRDEQQAARDARILAAVQKRASSILETTLEASVFKMSRKDDYGWPMYYSFEVDGLGFTAVFDNSTDRSNFEPWKVSVYLDAAGISGKGKRINRLSDLVK